MNITSIYKNKNTNSTFGNTFIAGRIPKIMYSGFQMRKINTVKQNIADLLFYSDAYTKKQGHFPIEFFMASSENSEIPSICIRITRKERGNLPLKLSLIEKFNMSDKPQNIEKTFKRLKDRLLHWRMGGGATFDELPANRIIKEKRHTPKEAKSEKLYRLGVDASYYHMRSNAMAKIEQLQSVSKRRKGNKI